VVILGLADIHGSLAAIERLGPRLAESDLVLLAGDLTDFGHERDAAAVVAAVERHQRNVLAVPGNCDPAEVWRYLADSGIGLDGCAVVRDGIGFVGVGGSIPFLGHTPSEMSESAFEERLLAAAAEVPAGVPMVLVSHQPPHGTVVDRVGWGRHAGSRRLRAFLEARRPLLCLCGHIHEGVGVEEIAGCQVVNPGPAAHGRYARVVIERGPLGMAVTACETRLG